MIPEHNYHGLDDNALNHGLDGLKDDTDLKSLPSHNHNSAPSLQSIQSALSNNSALSTPSHESVPSVQSIQSVVQTMDYKQTEVGVIPEDWEVKKLAEIAEIKTGPFGSSLHEKDYVIYGTPIITVEHLGELGIVHENMPMVSDKDRKRLSSYKIQTDDIVFSRVGSVDRNSIVSNKEDGWLFSGRLLRIRIFSKVIAPKYLSFYFHQETFKQRIRSVAVGQTMASLNTQILKGIDVITPPTLAEQNAIATALSDTDALISSLEKLIAKKRNIKQGAMQRLLRPKEGWEEKKLGEVIDFQGGSQPPLTTFIPVQKEGYIRLIQIRDYKTDKYQTYIPIKLARKFCYKEDIMIGRYGPPIFQILRGLEGAYNVALIKAIPSKQLNKEYTYYFLKQDSLFNFVEKLSQRSSGQTGVDLQQLKAYPIALPSISEQTQIVTILSDMDAEITALESKLDKYRRIKQGMMQNLLTGKIRLV